MQARPFVLFAVLLLAVSCGKNADPKRLEGKWVNVDNVSDQFELARFGEGLTLERDGEKHAVLLEKGTLRVSNRVGLYDRKTDRIMIDDKQYRRITDADREVITLKKTMQDMRAIATAWEARATDYNTYKITDREVLTSSDVKGALHPTYIRQLPARDGWGNEFELRTNAIGHEYWIRSYGANGARDETPDGATTDPNADIVFTNGTFTVYPQVAKTWQ